jgi:HSP20 family molecular chaperone IbpA
MMHTTRAIEVKHCNTPERTKEVILAELRRDFADWMETNRDEVFRPQIELTKEGNVFATWVVMRGVRADDIEIMAAPDILMIRGETADHRKLITSVKFPQPIDAGKIYAGMRDGLLSIRAEIARPANVVVFMPKAA